MTIEEFRQKMLESIDAYVERVTKDPTGYRGMTEEDFIYDFVESIIGREYPDVEDF